MFSKMQMSHKLKFGQDGATVLTEEPTSTYENTYSHKANEKAEIVIKKELSSASSVMDDEEEEKT